MTQNAASDARRPIPYDASATWRKVPLQPIKNFSNDPASVGVNRLIDAMAMFGANSAITGDFSGGDTPHAHALEYLAAHHEVVRSGRFLSEFRTAIK